MPVHRPPVHARRCISVSFGLNSRFAFYRKPPTALSRRDKRPSTQHKELPQEPKLKQAAHLPHHAAISRPPRPHTSLPSRAHRACASAQPRASSRPPRLPPPFCLPALPSCQELIGTPSKAESFWQSQKRIAKLFPNETSDAAGQAKRLQQAGQTLCGSPPTGRVVANRDALRLAPRALCLARQRAAVPSAPQPADAFQLEAPRNPESVPHLRQPRPASAFATRAPPQLPAPRNPRAPRSRKRPATCERPPASHTTSAKEPPSWSTDSTTC